MSSFVKYNEILVVDLESTCWEHKTDEQQQEIIEIGACILNVKSLKIHAPISLIVKPELSEVSEYCTKLTGLTQQDVNAGISLASACSYLRKEYDSKKIAWASWGPGDRVFLENQCLSKNIKYPMSERHLDVQIMFSVVFNIPQNKSVADSLSALKLKFEGKPHRGVDDAKATAEILKRTIRGGPI